MTRRQRAAFKVAERGHRMRRLHKWVKAPGSLFAMYICAVCGRDSMVKHPGICSDGTPSEDTE